MTDLTPEDPVGIGGYRLLRRLGAGGMGRVYLGRSSGGRTVAVKLVKPELACDPAFRARFRLEVEAARRVGERWTAPVLDADTEADTPWVATGYIAGPSLAQVVAAGQPARHGRGPLPPGSVRVLAYGLASALLDIHGAGLVHRDLKPSNVLLTIDGPRVIDFGIARALDEVTDTTLTGTGMVVGSPGFMSPEQITGGRLSAASDVFSLGGVLAHAATGRPPFGGGGGAGGVHSVMFRIASEEPDLGNLGTGPDADADAVLVRELITACLAKDPAARPAPEDVVAHVQPVAVGASAPPWLPAGLLAELGRAAVRLLDTDTPPSGSGMHGNHPRPGPAVPGTPVAPAPAEGTAPPATAPAATTPATAPPASASPVTAPPAVTPPPPATVAPATAPAATPPAATAPAATAPPPTVAPVPPTEPADAPVPAGADPGEAEASAVAAPTSPPPKTGAPSPSGPSSGVRPEAARTRPEAARTRPGGARTRRRTLLAVAAAVVLAGAGVAATSAGIGPLGDGGGGGGGRDDGGPGTSSDVPDAYVGTWVGAVQRDGKPNGQHRRFVITRGEEGEVVATSVSLGDDYECKSDGTLAQAPSSAADEAGLRLDTRVVKSVPSGRCAAIGEHTLVAGPGGVLKWRAAGRTATLHKVTTPERMPEALTGLWRRPLAGGGSQTLTVRATAPQDGGGLTLVSDGREHCEAGMDVFFAGNEAEPARVAPPEVDRTASRGTCATGAASTLRPQGEVLLRRFPDGRVLRYQRAS